MPSKAFQRRFKIFKDQAIYVATSPWRIFKFLCFSLGLVTLIIGGGIGIYTHHFLQSLPDFTKTDYATLKKMARHHVESKLEDKNQLPAWVEMDDISRDYIFSIVMSEDATFFEHNGIDIEAMLSSMSQNLKKKKYEYGASTISQQVVKNLFLTDEKSLSRKLKELLITLRLEKSFSKNQILELYLNLAEFGPDIYGVEEASAHYFKKKPIDVNAAEGAFIAIMLPSPRRYYYSVFENENITTAKHKRIRRILGDMLANEYISAKQYHQYLRYNYFSEKPREPASTDLVRRRHGRRSAD
jgi:monofunctional glycosyltransferase